MSANSDFTIREMLPVLGGIKQPSCIFNADSSHQNQICVEEKWYSIGPGSITNSNITAVHHFFADFKKKVYRADFDEIGSLTNLLLCIHSLKWLEPKWY